MKVILKKDVKSVGKVEQLVDVSDGYAKNYLIPKGLAVVADAKNVNIMKTKKAAEEKRIEKEKKSAKELQKKLKDVTVEIKAKSGGAGRLFGSITSKDIVEKLYADFAIDIDKRKLSSDAIKTLGEHIIDVKLYTGINAKLKVKVTEE
ncbi:MAG: 50S ribosomal protein L9 [Clostridiales bacterium]|nr:50S ribosomal protein L9 [Clostridiales bacterium]